jgi:hypothetical protein
MNFPEAVARIAAALDRARIPYMITGSFASVFYGSPRSTQDIDLVIDADAKRLCALEEILPAEKYYFELEGALEALKRESLFNVIDQRTGWKIDVIIRKSREFSVEEFQRRRRVNIEGLEISVATPEDLILAKLEWSKLGQSQRQMEDSARILQMHWGVLDRQYLSRWISVLAIEKEWNEALQTAGISGPSISPE